MEIVGIIHIISFICVAFYGFFVNKNKYDFYYIFFMLFVILNWNIFKGECIVSYLMKKTKDKNYVMGNDSADLDDMNIFEEKILNKILFFSINIFNIISVGIVLFRNNYLTSFFISLFIFLYFLLIMFVRNFYLTDDILDYYYFDTIYYYFRILFGIFILYVSYNILQKNKT